MKRVLDCNPILIICCEGKSLGEKNYFKQLHNYNKKCRSKFIKFDQCQLVVIEINKALDLKRLESSLAARVAKQKFSFIAIWKDNDLPENVQKENKKLCLNKSKMFEIVKEYLVEEKRVNENFAIWLLPKGWNFENFYRAHLTTALDISDKELKEKFKEYDFFQRTIFTEECFTNIALKLKSLGSNITLFNYEEKVKEKSKVIKQMKQIKEQEFER